MKFDNAQAAVVWAEELGTRPVCDSLLAKSFVRGGSGGLTPQEMRDIAHTITNYVYNLNKPTGILFLAVYGIPQKDGVFHVMDLVAKQISVLPEAENKDIEKLRSLVGAVIEFIRQKELYGKKMPKARMAKFINISRKSFGERGWPTLELEVRSILNLWLATAEEMIHGKLREWEWI